MKKQTRPTTAKIATTKATATMMTIRMDSDNTDLTGDSTEAVVLPDDLVDCGAMIS